jgi:ABC-type polar amino acid transport system ATPase subunit
MPTSALDQSTSVIEARAVSKRFGSFTVLCDVSLSVNEGEIVSLIGPSGSGKTTLLRCMALLEPVSSGEIVLEGDIVARPRADRALRQAAKESRREIGMVFQQFNLWPHLTVLQNIVEAPLYVKRMDRAAATAVAIELLVKVGLEEKKDEYPSRLSGGQQQRVAIARALAMSPRVLLFDEPTSALDPELRHEVLAVMQKLASEGQTMVVVTHEMGFARRVGSRVVFLDGGQIVEDSSAKAFFDAPRTIRARNFIERMM